MRDNKEKSRFELEVDGHIAYADYRLEDGMVLAIPYVYAPPELRGTGAAAKLMEQVCQQAQAEGLKILPICGYAATWIRRHAEYRGLEV